MTELEKLRAGLEYDFTNPEVDALKFCQMTWEGEFL